MRCCAVGAARRHGTDFGIAVDFHGRVQAHGQATGKALILSIDVHRNLLSEHAEALKDIANHTATPIALGERLFTLGLQKFSDGLVDIIQTDPSYAGGITETKKIAAMAEAYDVGLAPHCPLGPIALPACTDAVCYNADQEQSLASIVTTNDLLTTSPIRVFAFADGHVAIPQGPGLGITINEEAVARARLPAIAGGRRCGAMKTVLLRNGEKPMTQTVAKRHAHAVS